jgi:hypothetical protein
MTGEEAKVEIKETQAEVKTTAVTPEPPKTLTQEEVNQLIENATQKARDEEFQKYKGIQRVIAQKDKEIATLKNVSTSYPANTTSNLEPYKVMVEEMEAHARETGETNPRVAQMRALIAEEERKTNAEKQRREVEQYTQTWKEKLEAKIAEAGLTPEDEKFDDVWESFDVSYKLDGKFERAEKKLDRILKGVSKVPEVKKTEVKPDDDLEKKVQARLAEEKRKWMQENHLLETETSAPSAAMKQWKDIEANYIADPDKPANREAYLRARRERG